MNKLLQLSSIVLLGVLPAIAPAQPNTQTGTKQPAWVAGSSAGKTTGAISRLVYYTTSRYLNGNFRPADTFYYGYTGNNAWDDLLQEWKYDQYVVVTGNNRVVQTFDASGRVARRETQAKASATSAYQPSNATVFTYQNNRLAEEQGETYFNSKWSASSKTQYSYDGSGRVTERQSTDLITNAITKETSTYSPDGIILMESDRLANGVWVPLWKQETIYSGGKAAEMRYSTYNGTWNETARQYIVHNSASVVTTYYLQLNGSQFDTAGRSIDHYDANNNNDTTDFINMPNGIDAPESRRITEYNTHNQPTLQNNQVWNSGTGTWEYGQNAFQGRWHYFEFNLGISENTDVNTKLSLYPVPARNSITIDVATPQPLSVTIVHADGRRVLSWNQPASGSHYRETIDLSAIPDGNYFISVQTAKGVVTRAFNILR